MNKTPDTSQGYVVLTGTVEPEDGMFVSYCPELGVASCGDTVEEALDNLGDALAVHINALEEIGELDRVFRENQLKVITAPAPTESVSVSVPPGKTVRAYTQTVPPVIVS
ncbi:MAG: type II toxin-antitoxin system HicB family antitoxin [Chloroflexi bacterium]|nr:type II toxin-antitoxin system HicB family antitoxin [Chloroflexota bacterium]